MVVNEEQADRQRWWAIDVVESQHRGRLVQLP